jgi:hypothetical protein
MTWRRRLRRRLLWAGVLLGLVVLLATVTALRLCVWGRDLLTHGASRFGRLALDSKGGNMTRVLTLTVAVAAVAIATAPAALGAGRPAPPSQQSAGTTYMDAGARSAARPSALDPAAAAGRLQPSGTHVGLTVAELRDLRAAPTTYRASAPHRGATTTPPLAANPTYTTRPGEDAPAKLAGTRAQARLFDTMLDAARATSGRGIEWSQIGIGAAIGMALAIGLGLAVQAVRSRPLAH